MFDWVVDTSLNYLDLCVINSNIVKRESLKGLSNFSGNCKVM